MRLQHPTYSKPPIVEVALEVRFDGPWREEDKERLQDRFGVTYTGKPQRVPHFGNNPVALDTTLLPSDDGSRFVGIAARLLTIHALEPYPGWKEFKEQASDAINVYVRTLTPIGICGLGIRYLDRIVLPAKTVLLRQYFTCIPRRPRDLQALHGAHVILKSEESGLKSFLTVACDKDDEGPCVLYDISLERDFTPSVPINNWQAISDDLHTRQRDIFEDSITEKTRGLFV